MNVLLLGSGGRESAIAYKLAQSTLLSGLYIAPGNAGTSEVGTNVNLNLQNFEEVKNFVLQNQISMVVVGPEQPLVDGIHDYFLADSELHSIPVIGPQKKGAQLEGSKNFAKEFMAKFGIPTAKYQSFTKGEISEAKEFLQALAPPYVLKADGLAAGKGVVIPDTLEEAYRSLDEMLLDEKFGEASSVVVIEEFLKGIELSVFVLTDGKHYKILPSAKDYKRIGEGDTGLNTGGMGSISPVPFADDVFMAKVEEKIVKPTIEGLAKDGIPYQGFLFIGLMNVQGEPYVIEYNVRMGDPETESVMVRIKSDVLALFQAAAQQKLNTVELQIDERYAACVMMTACGYPEEYQKGKVLTIPTTRDENVFVFHAGTTLNTSSEVISNGGRVIAVTSMASSIEDALRQTYQEVDRIKFEGKYVRRDIGKDLICK